MSGLTAFKRLPERFRKENNRKLYEVIYYGKDELDTAANEIGLSRNIDEAYGQTLDYMGMNVGQLRLDEDDEEFRLLIKTKIMANLSNGDIPTINKVASILFKDNYLGVEETWSNDIYNDDIAGIIIYLKPTFSNIPLIMKRIKSGGISIYYQTIVSQENIEIQEHHSQLEVKYDLCGETKTKDKLVHSNVEDIVITEEYKLIKNTFKQCGDFKAKDVESLVEKDHLEIESEYIKIQMDYSTSGSLFCGDGGIL